MNQVIGKSVVALFMLLAGLASSSVEQGDDESTRKTLTGLKGVLVVIGKMESDIQQDGLSETQIRTDVELKLRQAGIGVLTNEELSLRNGFPMLYVSVGSLKTSTGYAYDLDLKLEQSVALGRNPAIRSFATTWSGTGGVGVVGASRVEVIRDHLRDLVDQFVNAYLAANPKR